MTQKLLICEDEADLRALLEITLQREGFVVRGSSDGQEFMALFEEDPPDLVLLDVMLPDVTGVELCRRIRKHPQHNDVPVILLTARNDEIDRVVGLAVGADDYVGKPFSVRELVMRVRAVLRRSQKETPAPAPEVGRIRVDVEGHRAWVDGQLLDLTAVELKLLNLFVSKPGRALTRDAIETLRGIGYRYTSAA